MIHFLFDGPPGPEGPRFIESETPDGRSINAGEWHERPDGLWELRVSATGAFSRVAALESALRKAEKWCRTSKGYPTTESRLVESCMNEVGVEVLP